MSSHAAVILFLVGVFLATGSVVLYNEIGQNTGSQTTPPSVEGLEITHISIYGIQDRQAQYLTIEVQGGHGQNLSHAYVSVTTPSGTAQLPLVEQG